MIEMVEAKNRPNVKEDKATENQRERPKSSSLSGFRLGAIRGSEISPARKLWTNTPQNQSTRGPSYREVDSSRLGPAVGCSQGAWMQEQRQQWLDVALKHM